MVYTLLTLCITCLERFPWQEGEKVRLISRINKDWLYGECNGKRGQFPSTFVDNVPSSLPMHS